uniref:Uncharacterized protein n=1 Tax=Rhabditophanes sp. KR3021 TaxID=114890 RepID=A0AC35UIM0_9BILA
MWDPMYGPMGHPYGQQMPMMNMPMQMGMPMHTQVALPIGMRAGYPMMARGRPELGGNIAQISGVQTVGGSPEFARVSLLNFLNDKDNFNAQGCGYDGFREMCHDALNICKGGCKDFSNSIGVHDCRCVPLGYANIIASLG